MKYDKYLWIVGPIGLLLIWVLLTAGDLVKPIFLPSPIDVCKALFSLASGKEGNLWLVVSATLLRAMLGLSLGVLIGVPLGLILGHFTRPYAVLQVPLDFFRSIPVTALFPFFLLLFGVGNVCKVIVVMWAVALLIVINTIYGVRGCSIVRTRYLRSIGAKPWHIFLYHILPEASPSIIAGIRISISQAFIVIIVTEMLFGGGNGMGYLLYSSALMYRTDEVLALILLTGFLGYGINKVAEKVGARIVFWKD
jgi:NitT/TauT family transport system permease protein